MPPLHRGEIYNKYRSARAGNTQNSGNKVNTKTKRRKGSDSTTAAAPMDPQSQQTLQEDFSNVKNNNVVNCASSSSPLMVPATLYGDDRATTTKTTALTTPWQMLRLWFIGNSLVSMVAWLCLQSLPITILAFLMMFTTAIIQGSWYIMKYRFHYGDSPLPNAPSHGIVKVVSNRYNPTIEAQILSTPTKRDNDNDDENLPEEHPLRLLVIGDSLAIGVGQSINATPILPETIAKFLSKATGGRPVLWTCHGAPGASAGWIVRELERSIQQGQFLQTQTTGHHHRTPLMELIPLDSCDSTTTDESSSDGSGDSDDVHNYDETQTWHERLRQERIQFDPQVVEPFDVAIVMTGSNDLKSAFFPFLLKGEDAEFRRQAQLRGGGYGKELTWMLQVLNKRMRKRLQTLREQMEAATERMRERLGSFDNNNSHSSIGGTRDNTISGPARRMRNVLRQSRHSASVSSVQQQNDHDDAFVSEKLDRHGMQNCWSRSVADVVATSSSSSQFPMVVLPGMPARALPIFQSAPLRWLAVPIVDIMDSHKQNLAKRHDGEVLFVDAPSPEQMTDYSAQTGTFWRQQQRDETILLNLRNIKRRHARQIEADMREYYVARNNNRASYPSSSSLCHFPYENNLDVERVENPETSPLQRRQHNTKESRLGGHLELMSVDGIHPNDGGYEFWGQHIAQAIVQEWHKKQPGLQIV